MKNNTSLAHHFRSALAAFSLIVVIALPVSCQALEKSLPQPFQGLWVDAPSHDACSQVKNSRDAMSAGEGALFLDVGNYYSQESDCSYTIATKSCCNSDNDDTRGGTLVCSKYRHPIIFHLRKSHNNYALIVATYTSDPSGPSLKLYQRCK